MDNQLALPKGFDERDGTERRKENQVIEFQDRRAKWWRRAADRREANGEPATALLFRNEAYRIEQEYKQ